MIAMVSMIAGVAARRVVEQMADRVVVAAAATASVDGAILVSV